MDLKNTALILIGYQNEYFAEDGILHSIVEGGTGPVMENTISLIDSLSSTGMMMITTPINFTTDYSELVDPVGILKIIKDAGAFKADSVGALTSPELEQFKDQILEVPGKRGLNAFADTDLEKILKKKKIKNLAFAGAVTSVCIDSTGRSAFEKGYKVTQLSDCTVGRTDVEQDFYCNNIFPLYAKVDTSENFLKELKVKKS
jgi:nicotinamidase-related amidase